MTNLAKAISEAFGHVEVRDRQGDCLDLVIQGMHPNAIETAKRRAESNGPWRTTEQLMKRLETLESE